MEESLCWVAMEDKSNPAWPRGPGDRMAWAPLRPAVVREKRPRVLGVQLRGLVWAAAWLHSVPCRQLPAWLGAPGVVAWPCPR